MGSGRRCYVQVSRTRLEDSLLWPLKRTVFQLESSIKMSTCSDMSRPLKTLFLEGCTMEGSRGQPTTVFASQVRSDLWRSRAAMGGLFTWMLTLIVESGISRVLRVIIDKVPRPKDIETQGWRGLYLGRSKHVPAKQARVILKRSAGSTTDLSAVWSG